MSNVSKKQVRFTTLSLLVTLLLILGFTPLGFIAVPPVAITLLHVPIIIGALLLGPVDGMILGFIFGLISMFKATTASASPVDMLFSPVLSGAPLFSILLCIVPRVILGAVGPLVNKFLLRFTKNRAVTVAISSGIATLCHTFLVLGLMNAFFSAISLKEIF